MPLVHLVIGLALAEFFFFMWAVARARVRFGVAAPATAGHEVFERYFRMQMNTLEQLIVFVPSIVLFARYVRSEEHTSELQSPMYLVCRLLLEKKNITTLSLTPLL